MAEDYCGGPNWWDSSSATRSRFDGGGGGGGSSSTSSTTTLANSGGGGYGWLTEGSSTVDPVPPAASSPSFQDTKIDGSSLLVSLGLSTQAMDWNQQPILNPEKQENSFRSMLQEGMGLNTNFQQDTGGGGAMFGSQWSTREKLFPSNEDNHSSEFKQIGRGFSLDQSQFSPSCSSMESTVTCQGLTPTSFQLDSSSSSSVYGSPSSILQGFISSDQQNQHHQQTTPINYPTAANNSANNSYQQNYFGMAAVNSSDPQSQLASSWAKVPQFLRSSSPKQHQQQQQQQQLHFTNNAPYWNGSTPGASMADIRPSFFSSLQTQLPMPTFEEKPKNTLLEVRDTSSTAKKSGQENNNNNSKRARNEAASSTLPPFKVRKEKMGDRITALQQLVSPFGKTDTASVLSEAIEYIKFLHEQVSVLSTPYLKSGGNYQQHQPSNDKAKIDPDGPKQDLRSRGLCLVPVSSTFPVTHETTVDFWTPTFGGTFR